MRSLSDLPAKVVSGIVIFAVLMLSGCAGTQQTVTDEQQPKSGETEKMQKAPRKLPSEMNRPVPNPITYEIPNAFYRALNQGTRTMSGEPGSNYWQQWTNYDIDVELIPEDTLIAGTATITYHNNSPNSLNELLMELSQNLHREGAIRSENAEVTGGINLQNIAVDGTDLSEIQSRFDTSGYSVNGTSLIILPGRPVAPGDSISIQVTWNFKIPQQGASGRMGYSEDNLYFIAYWYPQMRVYDDVIGWMNDQFTGNAEFYHGFGNYNVDITVPEQWMVASTGSLSNGETVLTDTIYQRLQKAHSGDRVVQVVGKQDFGNVTQSGKNGKVTWNFKAEQVRDFAFSATKESMWDATRAGVGDLDGDGQEDYSHINTIYRSSAPLWTDGAKFTSHAISFLSDFTGVKYPWPHMTSVEGGGIIGGGMEFPMMTIIGSYRGREAQALYAVIAHELAHMWVPMQLSSNERRYGWMDEGTTTFNENQAKNTYYPDEANFHLNDMQTYLQIVGTDAEGPIMRWTDHHYNGFADYIATYPKPATMLYTLRNLLGEETFREAFETFMQRWQYKHPYPWDLFNTFEDVSGRDLDWFWRSWYYETWWLDQAVGNVNTSGNSTQIVIEDHGQAPMPAVVQITFDDGSSITRNIPVETWLRGNTRTTLTVENSGKITKVVIDPDQLYPDVDRQNNVWQN